MNKQKLTEAIEAKMKKIADLRASIASELKSFGKAELAPDFVAFFAANPRIESLRWEQYTDYFNDGEPCEFSVREPRVSLVDGDEKDGEYQDGYLSTYDLRSDTDHVEDGVETVKSFGGTYTRPKYKSIKVEPIGVAEASALDEFWSAICDDDIFQSVFGDHVQITVTRDGEFTVEDHDHD